MRKFKINKSYRVHSSEKHVDINPIILDEAEEIHRWAESRVIHLVFSMAIILLGALTMILLKLLNTLF